MKRTGRILRPFDRLNGSIAIKEWDCEFDHQSDVSTFAVNLPLPRVVIVPRGLLYFVPVQSNVFLLARIFWLNHCILCREHCEYLSPVIDGVHFDSSARDFSDLV